MSLALADRATERPLPRLGGLSTTLVSLEVRRALRNRRVLIFTLVMPPLLFLLIGAQQKGDQIKGTGADGAAYSLVSLAVYGAMVAATSSGAAVGAERAQGWSRQLRLTPLRPWAYIVAKVCVGMVLALASVLAEVVTGAVLGVSMGARQWLLCFTVAWLGALVFAAFGLAVGYLLPTDNAMQVIGPLLAVMSTFGGLFVPLELLPHTVRMVAHWTPVYGVSSIARAPLTHGDVTIGMIGNVVLWGVVFAGVASRAFRRDTRRV
ncbi:ABC-2 type transport system permease protein [Motilibacter rhizosphaerae]|uniref:Transport permease protein n=1 Tax=Motilibacter rhizosphaerae TaxID=598652 RepID=A0A4Q7NRI9_9ACTN|nr:ABC transporter permease [Motilibacter rhizosphaerae]RZS89661.1 ABC-2 type transport system permease protein [Motilibacter rhizosphaerae]